MANIDKLPKSNYIGPLAQEVEQRSFKAWVDGSNPSRLKQYLKD